MKKTVPERLLGNHPWRNVAIFMITLSLAVLFLVGLLIDQRGELAGLKVREEERARAADVAKTITCFQSIQDAPNGLALLAFLDRNARLRIQANRAALRRDPSKSRDPIRRRLIADDQGARRALQGLRDRFLSNVRPLEECVDAARELELDPTELGFNLTQLARIQAGLSHRSIQRAREVRE